MLVIEGLDRLGKSKMAGYISRQLIWPVIKPIPSKDPDGLISLEEDLHDFGFKVNDFFEDLLAMEVLHQVGRKGVILDRSIVSADVYRKHTFPQSIFDYWLKRFKQMDGLYVWIDAEYSFYLQRLRELGELNDLRVMDIETWNRRRSEFARYFQNIEDRIGKHRVLYVHNYDHSNLRELAENIIDFVKQR